MMQMKAATPYGVIDVNEQSSNLLLNENKFCYEKVIKTTGRGQKFSDRFLCVRLPD